jgi:two-component system, chemotaxis family, chemotaxis protein CheY
MKNYNLKNLSVLVIEKHPGMRGIFRDVLRELGVQDVRVTVSDVDGYEMFKERPPDLVLTDWSPDVDGIDLTRIIRRDQESPDPYVPIVVVTGYTELSQVIKARDAGMTEFLAKPVTAKRLYGRICSVVENHRIFINNQEFTGPDRRRRRINYGGSERREHANISGPDRRKEQALFDGKNQRLLLPGKEAEIAQSDESIRDASGPLV